VEAKHPLRAYLEERLGNPTRENPIGVSLARGRAMLGYSELTRLAHQAGDHILRKVAGQATLRSLARELEAGLNEEFILTRQTGSDRDVINAIETFYAEGGFTQVSSLNRIPSTEHIGKAKQTPARPLVFSKGNKKVEVYAVRAGNEIDISVEEK
jgi:hypothetical protein